MTITFTSLAKPVALYTLHLSTGHGYARCFVYRAADAGHSTRLVTSATEHSVKAAVKQAVRNVRTARKCGGLAKG